MFKFIQTALTELEHVVWPTPNETKKYMVYTVGVIIVIALFLAILGYGIYASLSFIRDQFPHEAIPTTVSGENAATQEDLSGLLNAIDKKKKSTSGSVSSGSTKSAANIIIATGSSNTVTIGTGVAK